jgi:Cu+-exporting ATPase
MSSTQYDLTVSGMNCPNCVDKIKRALRAVPGVTEIDVDLSSKRARVSVAESHTTNEDLVAALVNAGYGAKVA